jgi:HAUS augmin-like complex subunit 1
VNHELRSESFAAPRELARQTLDWNRNTKQLRSKVAEYNDRLGALNPLQVGHSPYSSPRKNDSPAPRTPVEEVVEQEKRVLQLGEEVKELEEQVKAFKGLPKDANEARREVENLRQANERLKQTRDRLFENLVGG